jgi:hypothetical protein
MTLHQIKTMLYARKIKPITIAKRAGVSHITVTIVLNGYGKSRKVQKAVAELLNKPYEKLWGTNHHHEAILSNRKRVVNDN